VVLGEQSASSEHTDLWDGALPASSGREPMGSVHSRYEGAKLKQRGRSSGTTQHRCTPQVFCPTNTDAVKIPNPVFKFSAHPFDSKQWLQDLV